MIGPGSDKKGRRRIREDEVLTELTPKVISKEETSNFDNIILNGVLCVIAVFTMAGIMASPSPSPSSPTRRPATLTDLRPSITPSMVSNVIVMCSSPPPPSPSSSSLCEGVGEEEVPPMICATGPHHGRHHHHLHQRHHLQRGDQQL